MKALLDIKTGDQLALIAENDQEEAILKKWSQAVPRPFAFNPHSKEAYVGAEVTLVETHLGIDIYYLSGPNVYGLIDSAGQERFNVTIEGLKKQHIEYWRQNRG